MNRVLLSTGYYPEKDRGRPIANAAIYVGKPDTDPEIVGNQIQLYAQEEDGIIVSLSQPVYTSAGGTPTYNGSPVTLLVSGAYSLKVLDSSGAQQYYVPRSYEATLATLYLSEWDGSLPDAISSIGSDDTTLIIDVVPNTLTANLTIPSNVALEWYKGCVIGGAFTLTINGSLGAGAYQLFDDSVSILYNSISNYKFSWRNADFGQAVSDIGITPTILIIDSTPAGLTSDVSVPTNIILDWKDSNVLSKTVYKLTVNAIVAGRYRLFEDGSYVVGLDKTKREWFGGTDQTAKSNLDNWKPRDSTDLDISLLSVAWSESLHLFAAVGGGSKNGILTSVNGKDWIEQTMPVNQSWTEVIWASGPAVFVAVSITGTTQRVMTSPDGITWTARTTPDTAYRSVAWSPDVGDPTNGRLCAVTNSKTGTRVITSDDGGITWTSRTYPFGDEVWVSVEWVSTLQLFFVTAVNTVNGQAMTSPDGITWGRRGSSTAAGDNWQASAWSEELGILVVVLNTGTNRVRTSRDAVNFEEQVTPNIPGFGNPSYHDVLWIPEWMQFIAIANTGLGFQCMSSYDGFTWEARQTVMKNSWEGLAYSPTLNLLVAVSDNTLPSAIGNHIMTTSGTNEQEQKPTTLGFNRTIRKYKEVSQSVVSSTTLVEVDGFTQEYEAGDKVSIVFNLIVDADAAADIKLSVAYIAGAGSVSGTWGVVGGAKFDASNNWVRALDVNLGSNIIFGCAGAGQFVRLSLAAKFEVSSDRIKIGLKFAQNVANTVATIINAGSTALITH